MINTPEKTVPFDTTEGLLYRALCCLIERHGGHLTISVDELNAASGQFALSSDGESLILTTLRGDGTSH